MERAGFSIQKIAEPLVMDRHTVKHLLLLSEEAYLQQLETPLARKSSLDAYEELVWEKLILYPSTSATQMHDDWLKEHNINFPSVSSKTTFNFVRSVRNKYNIPKTEAQRDYSTVPSLPYGRQVQVDFGFYNMPTIQGKTKKVQFFAFVLAQSRYKYIYFRDTPFTTESVLDAHEKAFQFIKGHAFEIVYDQDRLFIVLENLGDIIMSAVFRAYVRSANFTTYFCRKTDPETKGKVENVVKYLKRNFLYNRSFRGIEILNSHARAWLSGTANAMIHSATKLIP